MADNSTRNGVFISHATQDGTSFAQGLRAALEQEGVFVWQDVIQLPRAVGDDWWKKITDAIDHVNYVIMIITPAAFDRETVIKEWRYARRIGVCVIPVKASPDLDLQTIPRWMSKAQFAHLGYSPTHDAFTSPAHHEAWKGLLGKIYTPCVTAHAPFMVDDLGIYVQRDAQFNQLIDLLLDKDQKNPRAITGTLALRGAGGYGKTTLARAICHDERTQSAYSDGILWVTLGENATYDTVRAKLNILVEELSGGQRADLDVELAKTRLRELMADRDILLVIDDVWKREHLKPFLQGGARVARLITTRNDDVLPPAAARVTVASMTSAEAADLIAYEFSADDRAVHTADFVLLAQRLGEYALLLTLANGALRERIRAGETLSNALDYLKRALEKRGITRAIQIDNSDDRHRAVDATLRLSIELLNPQQQTWLARLAIFPEDASIPFRALEKAWRCDDLDVEDGCAALNRLSLLLRYDLTARTIQLHDIIRLYLREQIIGGADALRATNADFLDAYARSAWRDLPLDEPYLWDHLAYHLIEAERGDDLITTVLDLHYLARKTSVRGTAAAEADLLDAAKRETTTPALELLTRNYRNLAHILARCADERDTLLTLHARLHHLPDLQSVCEAVEPLPIPRSSAPSPGT